MLRQAGISGGTGCGALRPPTGAPAAAEAPGAPVAATGAWGLQEAGDTIDAVIKEFNQCMNDAATIQQQLRHEPSLSPRFRKEQEKRHSALMYMAGCWRKQISQG